MIVKRIHYSGGLSKERFLENSKRKPTLLRVKALMSDQGADIQTRTFGLVLESDSEDLPEETSSQIQSESRRPNLTIVQGGVTTKE